MTAYFDIFQAETCGDVLWLGAAVTPEDAKARVQEFAQRAPAEFLVLNQRTGQKLVIDFNRMNEAQAAD